MFCREGYAGANIDLVAAEAGVSRQTVYNHHGDKEKLFTAVVREVTERINAEIFATLATFPDKPEDLHRDLTAFAKRMDDRATLAPLKADDAEQHRRGITSQPVFEIGQQRLIGYQSFEVVQRALDAALKG